MDRSCVQKKIKSKPTGQRLLGRPRLRWNDDIRLDLKTERLDNWHCVSREMFKPALTTESG